MSYFPLCVNLKDRRVLLVGSGPEVQDKRGKLLPFEPCLVLLENLTAEDLTPTPALVVVGDLPENQARSCSELCRERNIPVNVVDRPELCSFFFPALICQGDLTVAVSTGGKSPAAAALLRRQISRMLPDATEEILLWLEQLRAAVRTCNGPARRAFLNEAAAAAFGQGGPLPETEVKELMIAHFGQIISGL